MWLHRSKNRCIRKLCGGGGFCGWVPRVKSHLSRSAAVHMSTTALFSRALSRSPSCRPSSLSWAMTSGNTRRTFMSPAWTAPKIGHSRSLRWLALLMSVFPFGLLFHRYRERRKAELHQRAEQITDFVYLDLAKGDRYLGRLLIGVFGDLLPLTVNNFMQLAEGYSVRDKIIGYKNTLLHAIIPGKLILGGDVVTGKGSDSLSIYGPMFPDENFSQRFIRKGDVAMFSRKPNGNGSMFLIALRPLTEENGRFVVFGTVVKGIELLSVLTADINPNRRAVDFGRVTEPIRIVACGVYTDVTKGPASYIADKEQQMERKITFATGHAHQPLSDIWRVSQLALEAAKRDLATHQGNTAKIQQELREAIRPILKDRRHDLFLSASPEERAKLHRGAYEEETRRSNPVLYHRAAYAKHLKPFSGDVKKENTAENSR